MWSVLAACAAIVTHAVFLATVAFGAPCPERCADDGPDGRCPPVCEACACVPRARRETPVAALSAPSAPAVILVAPVMHEPGEPDPREISHVPKERLLAQ
jgi:hypothetical protein